MIQELKDTPNTMVGFVATSHVTKEDFDRVVLPAVAELVQRTDKLNYLLVIDRPHINLAIVAWLTDAMLQLNNIDKWDRAAVVYDTKGINSFTELFGKSSTGDFKGFNYNQLDEAIRWVGRQHGSSPKQVFQEEGDSKD